MRNHLRLLAGLLGVVELAAPRALVRVVTRLAYRESADLEPREWMYTAARIEGLILTTLALVGLYRAATAAEAAAGNEGAARKEESTGNEAAASDVAASDH